MLETMAGIFVDETKDSLGYRYNIIGDAVVKIGDITEPRMMYEFSKERIKEITQKLNELQLTIPPSTRKEVFKARTTRSADDVTYEWIASGVAVRIIANKYTTRKDPYELTIYPPKADIVNKVKGVLAGFMERRHVAEIAVATNQPPGMFSKEVGKYLGGKKSRKAKRKARKTKRRL